MHPGSQLRCGRVNFSFASNVGESYGTVHFGNHRVQEEIVSMAKVHERTIPCRPIAKILYRPTQQTRNICITFVQCWTNVEDVGPALYKCHTTVLCLLGRPRPTHGRISPSLVESVNVVLLFN